MNVRFGKCASCAAEYKVPDSFQHDMARCRECGGVAHFGPPQAPDATPQYPAEALGSVADAAAAGAAAAIDKLAGGADSELMKPTAASAPKPTPMPAKQFQPKAADVPKASVPKPAAPKPPTPKAVTPKQAAPTPPVAKPVVPRRQKGAMSSAPKAPAAPKAPVAPKAAPAKPKPVAAPAKPELKRAPATSAPKQAAAAASGGSMLERLKAQRQAEAAAAGSPASGKPKPAGKSAAGANRPMRAAAPKTASKPTARRAAADDDEGGRQSTRTRPSGGRRSGTKRRGRGAADDEDDEGGSRRGAKEKKSAMPMMIGLGVIVIGAVLFFAKDSLFGSDQEVGATDGTDVASAGTGIDPADQEVADAPDTNVDTEKAPESGELFEGVDPKADDGGSKKKIKKVPLGKQDPDSVDLTLYQFGPIFNTTDDEWETMQGLMTTWMDPDAGAAGGRSRRKLLEFDAKAFPVMLNAMTKLDLGSVLGLSNGDLCQREFEKLLSGKNFGWAYVNSSAEDADYEQNRVHVMTKKIVRSYCRQWEKVVEQGLPYFLAFAKLDKEGLDAVEDPAVKAQRKARLAALYELVGEAAPGEAAGGFGMDDDLDMDVD